VADAAGTAEILAQAAAVTLGAIKSLSDSTVARAMPLYMTGGFADGEAVAAATESSWGGSAEGGFGGEDSVGVLEPYYGEQQQQQPTAEARSLPLQVEEAAGERTGAEGGCVGCEGRAGGGNGCRRVPCVLLRVCCSAGGGSAGHQM
jgi:hypothetical protein